MVFFSAPRPAIATTVPDDPANREVNLTILHYKITKYERGVHSTKWTEQYSAFNCAIAKPIAGFTPAAHNVHCPYCDRAIAVQARSDLAGKIARIASSVFLLTPIIVLATFGFHYNGLKGMGGGIAGGVN